jgi:hypothetical protein
VGEIAARQHQRGAVVGQVPVKGPLRSHSSRFSESPYTAKASMKLGTVLICCLGVDTLVPGAAGVR